MTGQMNTKEKYIYRFGNRTVDGDESMSDLLGGKGAGLAGMTKLSIPVPPGFTIGTDACRYYLQHGVLPAGFADELKSAMHWLEQCVGRRFNDEQNPLLVSVRSGAAISMPGMMDTILNVGLTRKGVDGLARESGSLRFALDSYRRLLQMMGTVVLETPKAEFDAVMDSALKREDIGSDSELSEAALTDISESFHKAIARCSGRAFPEDAQEQLSLAINSVFKSWSNVRARTYRRLNGISDELGTAVTVQAMVFGNAGCHSGTGVGFTRNPSTGNSEVFGEFLTNAQGEDIVAGTRTPVPIAALASSMPEVYEELSAIVRRLESHYRDVQDFEFTIEKGKLFLLQTRSAKRSAIAAVRIAVDMVQEGLITRREAVTRIEPSTILEILAPQLDLSVGVPEIIAVGIPASSGAAVGRIVLSSDEAVRIAAMPESDPVILVSHETTAEDIHGMAVAAGFLTARGGATSHAAVVARGMGKCCITGAKSLLVDEAEGVLRIGDAIYREGDWISLDASTGRVFAGKLPMHSVDNEHPELDTILEWAIDLNHLDVRANADTPEDARSARLAGACGIGLCRTEHMFFAPERLPLVRAMILASDHDPRRAALSKLLPMQQADFEEIFREMSPLPVTVRLLDPPLHEFLPALDEIHAEIGLAREGGKREVIERLELLLRRVRELNEINPMMGHRGCRLSVTYPEMLQMQVQAILQAALTVKREGLNPQPEIMVPLVGSAEEMGWLRGKIDEVAGRVFEEHALSVRYLVGTMIELPRAAICAGAIAEHVSFVSFGTNDLTQMTFGFSRDDASSFLGSYLEQGLLKSDPFVTIDRPGVGALMKMAIKQLRSINPQMKVGVCGEHGGDPRSIDFFASLGVDYISCSPARVPVAQLAVAQITASVSMESEPAL
ncbi:MAG: pyruvate, phosphate dikinase [Acidobacteriales bacterium]|nr:pyruvate, phosphate dikinase [Terriglobales bacterium]